MVALQTFACHQVDGAQFFVCDFLNVCHVNKCAALVLHTKSVCQACAHSAVVLFAGLVLLLLVSIMAVVSSFALGPADKNGARGIANHMAGQQVTWSSLKMFVSDSAYVAHMSSRKI